MQIAATNFFLTTNPKVIYHKQTADYFTPKVTCINVSFPSQMGYGSRKFSLSKNNRYLPAACAVLSEDVSVSSSQFEDFSVTNATNTTENKELKIRVEVSGAKTRAIFNNVFDKMVAEAQPIPGFRRVKGGKTPNIPRDILLEILGPSKVYKQVIEEVINSTVAAYVEKEALKVGKDLRIEQSYEDLEDQFEPDEKFFFDAIIQLKESN
ncbi:trigger factor isoform X2 [Benincasa hispida]|uniref:trigger factor isoform X2 n=1 Tax=Benincasa hispida TaxID=102211 RepID=UPI0018FF7C19|nr:trigger factor isoform X2 [Benincasa hispida]